MNKAFKVLWSRFRNSYVVASEATASRGKAGKAVKTAVVVAAALTMAGAAQAEITITNDSFGPADQGKYDTTKFLSGGNETTINIQTTGDATKLLEALGTAFKDQENPDLSGLMGALGTANGVTLVGFAGGENFVDGGTKYLLGVASDETMTGFLPTEVVDAVEDIDGKFEDVVGENPSAKPTVENSKFNKIIESNKTIVIGGEGFEPLMIASVGADRVVNTGFAGTLDIKSSTDSSTGSLTGEYNYKDYEISLERKGDIALTVDSGNLFGLIGGSSAINIGGLQAHAEKSFLAGLLNLTIDGELAAKSTSVTIDGKVATNLQGSTNAAGVFTSGSAIALGGAANSTVTQGAELNITSGHSASDKLSGLTVGAFGGGLAVSTLNGEATATTQGLTEIHIGGDAVAVGTFGSGAALSTELQGAIWDAVKGLKVGDMALGDNIHPSDLTDTITEDNSPLLINGGTAKVVSGDIDITADGNSVTVALAGGGVAAASSGGNGGKAAASVETGNITIRLGDKNTPVLSQDNRMGLQTTASTLVSAIRPVLGDVSVDGVLGLTDDVTQAVTDSQNKYQGAHVGTVGGSIVIARMPSGKANTTATAEATSENVTIYLNGGYNVATLGGGMTIATGYHEAVDTYARATVKSTAIKINGGDNVLVMAGGAAYATGDTKGMDKPSSEVESTSIVTGNAAVKVNGGTVDGIFGGGLAIDDTGAANENATANVGSVTITIYGGTINAADPSPLAKIAEGVSAGAPTNGTYVDDTADLLAKDLTKAAIVGGGIATGAGAKADVKGSVTINLWDASNVEGTPVIEGNVYAGGAATLGGKSYVKEALISLNGATVNGDIYGGGLVGSPRNNSFDGATEYAEASTTVDTVTIDLAKGSVNNVYAGGYTYEGSEGVTNTVEVANINLSSAVKLNGNIDGSGATTSTLTFKDGYDFETTQTVKGFNVIQANGLTTDLNYEFADDKDVTKVLGTGAVEFDSLSSTGGKTLQVGDAAEGAGLAVITGEALVTKFEGLTMQIDNGMLAFNTDGNTAEDVAASAPTTAAAKAYFTGAVNVGNNKVLVGDVKESSASESGVYVGSNGMLIADAAVNTKVENLTSFEEGATIHFAHVDEANGTTVTIGTGDVSNVATSVDNVLYEASLQEGTTNTYTFSKRQDLASVGLDGTNTGFLEDLNNHPDNPGAEYISQFLDQTNTSVNNGNRAQQINAAMNLAAAAGVQTMAIDGTMIGVEAANKRASIINNFVDGGVLFAEISGRHSEVGGDSGFGEIEADLGGIVVGGEYTTNDWTFGALANLGTGSVDGQGDNSGVENDVDYYGIQAYVGKRFGQFNLVGQIGYLMSENDISQKTIGHNTADVDADVWTVGLRGEFRFDVTDNSRLVPYIGLNYLRVSTDGYHTSAGVKVDDVDQNLWTMPVGVKYAGDMQTASGWTWTPSVDVAYIPAFGDDDVDATTDVGARGSTTMDVWADSVARMKFGIRANKDNFGIGLEAGAAAGSDDFTEYFGQVRVDYRF